MVRNAKKDFKTLVAKNIGDCKQIAQTYINSWKPTNPAWDTIEGAVYLRLSTDMQVSVEKGSLEQQVYIAISEAETRSTSERINYKIMQFYVEPGITGRNDKRPEFQRLQRDIINKRHKFVIFKELARIARDSLLWKSFFRTCIENDCAVCIRGFPINPNDPSQLFLLDILAAAAEYESNLTAKRIRENVFFAMKTSGKFNSTKLLLGFDQLVINGEPKVGFYSINADEVKMVEWIFEEFCRLASYERIAQACRDKGIKNKDGEPLSGHTLRNILSNTRYIGKWEINIKNKGKDPRRIMPYEHHLAVDLPCGPVISMDLWVRVQKTIAEVAGNHTVDKATKRTYPLSAILKYEDGTSFAGTGAWSSNNRKHCYYWNRTNGVRIPVDLLESEAEKMIEKVIANSTSMSAALKQRDADKTQSITRLDLEMKTVKFKIDELKSERAKLDRRLDFLLENGSPEEKAGFKNEYTTNLVNLKNEQELLQIRLAEMESSRVDLLKSTFDLRTALDSAKQSQDDSKSKQMLKLRVSYRKLFQAIIVGSLKEDGTREVRFQLREGPTLPTLNVIGSVEDQNCTRKMVEVHGFEPRTLSMPL